VPRQLAAVSLFLLFFADAGWAQVPERPGQEEQVEAKQPIQWHGDLTMSVMLQNGVTNQRQFSLSGGAFRRNPDDNALTWSYGLQGDYTFASVEIEDVFQSVADSQNIRFTAERQLSERLYFVLRPAAKRNEIQGVEYRVEELGGLGVEVHESKAAEFDVIGVIGGVQEEKGIPESDGGSFAAGAIQTSEFGLPRGWRISQMFLYLAPFDDADDYRMQLHASITGAIFRRVDPKTEAVTKQLGMQLSYDIDRENLVVTSTGQADRKFMVGLQLTF
jgi:hypothetical protein